MPQTLFDHELEQVRRLLALHYGDDERRDCLCGFVGAKAGDQSEHLARAIVEAVGTSKFERHGW